MRLGVGLLAAVLACGGCSLLPAADPPAWLAECEDVFGDAGVWGAVEGAFRFPRGRVGPPIQMTELPGDWGRYKAQKRACRVDSSFHNCPVPASRPGWNWTLTLSLREYPPTGRALWRRAGSSQAARELAPTSAQLAGARPEPVAGLGDGAVAWWTVLPGEWVTRHLVFRVGAVDAMVEMIRYDYPLPPTLDLDVAPDSPELRDALQRGAELVAPPIRKFLEAGPGGAAGRARRAPGSSASDCPASGGANA